MIGNPDQHSGQRSLPLLTQQALAALRAGDGEDAERLLRARLLEAPRDTVALTILADRSVDVGDFAGALILSRRTLAIDADQISARIRLVRLYQHVGDFGSALTELDALPSAARDGFDVAVIEAALLGKLGRHEAEIAVYSRLVAEAPGSAPLWMSYGNALKTAGRTEEAVAAFRKTIRAKPDFGEAYWSLANLKTVRFLDKDLYAMRKALAGKLSAVDALHFHFALGKALEERGEAGASFQHYNAGNSIRASMIPAPHMSIAARVDAAIATFDRPLLNKFANEGDPARDPIFIVGLQRSGSTLIEQILASHPMIEGTSELTIIESMWAELGLATGDQGSPFQRITGFDAAALRALGSEYLRRARAFRLTDRPMFIDKLPANWLNVGFIRLILPNACIVDARRNPMACGFSNFKQHYATGVSFSYSLEAIGNFYRDYLRLMGHFEAVLPGVVHRVVNEELVANPEREVRALLDHVGVPFEAACLEFHRNRRPVRSPSAEQVRRPLNRDGIDSWRRFEPWLGPLKSALGSALIDWNQPPALATADHGGRDPQN